MPIYRWTCHGCSAVNEPEHDCCSECGLSATANAEEVELHSCPGAYKRKKTIDRYQKDLVVLVMVPFFGISLALHGRIEALLLILFGLGLVLQKNTGLLGHIWSNKWATSVLVLWSSTITALMAIRITVVPDDSAWVGYITLFLLIFQIGMYFYFFKSEKAQDFFGRYYEMANK